MSENNN